MTNGVLLPLYLILFYVGILPWALFWFVVVLSVLEHLSTEIYRLLIVYGKPVLASFGFFLRLGLWPLMAGATMLILPNARTLETIMSFWIFGAVLSIFLPILLVVKYPRRIRISAFDWSWIKTGFAVALPFLIGTVCLRGIQTIDRYFINTYVGPDILGAFVFFAGLASVLPAMLQAGVYSFVLAPLISAIHEKDRLTFKSKMSELKIGIIVASVILSVSVIIGAYFLLMLIERPIYYENFSFLWFAVAANIIFCGVHVFSHSTSCDA